jgi:hypothetical protein
VTAYTAELVTDPVALARLAGEWERLYRSCGTATPFQSHPWLHAWWRSYGRPGRLRLWLVRAGGAARGTLVAAAPLTAVRRPLPALVPLGGPLSDWTDVLVDDEHREPALAALGDALASAARTAVIDLPEVRPGGAAELLYDRWSGPRRTLPGSVCLELPGGPMNTLIARLGSAKAQQRARAQLRRLDALGVERRAVEPGEVDKALRRLQELHRLQWQGRKVTGEHLTDRFLEHLVRAAGPMVRAGDAVVTEFRLEDDVVAVDLTLLSPRMAGGYLYGAHPCLRERKADVAVMLLQACAAHTSAGGGRGTLSLLRGEEPYKLHWRPERVPNSRLLLARATTAPLLAAAVARDTARRRAKEVLRRREGRSAGP